MAKETQKEKLDRLEQELCTYKVLVNNLQKEISVMQDKSDNAFINSPTYVQLTKRIEFLETKNNILEEQIKHKDNVHKLINEQKKNDRGAGRKTKFTDYEIATMQMYRLQGKTIRELSKMYKCSVGLVHKLIDEQ